MEMNSGTYFHTDWSLRSSTRLLYFFLQRDAGRHKMAFVRMLQRQKIYSAACDTLTPIATFVELQKIVFQRNTIGITVFQRKF